MKKTVRRIVKVKQTHPLFKMRGVKVRYYFSPDKTYESTEYQCPCCKRWFISYSTGTLGIRLHITRTAKIEAVACRLKELKKSPHFEFWEKNTEPINALHKPREWKMA